MIQKSLKVTIFLKSYRTLQWNYQQRARLIKLLQKPELEKVLTFRVANLPDYRRVALQTFRIAIWLLSYFTTFRVALLPHFLGFCDFGYEINECEP